MELIDIKNEVEKLDLSSSNRAEVDTLIQNAEQAGVISDEARAQISAVIARDAEEKEATAVALEGIADSLT